MVFLPPMTITGFYAKNTWNSGSQKPFHCNPNLYLLQHSANQQSSSAFDASNNPPTRCIQITKEILNEEPIIEYCPSFLNGLELDAFFQKYQIALEVQGAQHRLHSTSWYKDVKKLEDIINRDRQKRCMCQDNGIFLIEV
ncbi:15163_t:CDS:2, partial [Funneliformis geosporum]